MRSSKKVDIIQVSVRYVFRVRKKFFGIFFSIALGIAGLIMLVTMGSEVRNTLNDDLELLGGATVIRCQYERGLSAQERLIDPLEFTDEVVEAVRKMPGCLRRQPAHLR